MFLDLETGDGRDRPFYSMASGLWPRFSRYEIREKGGRQFICPEKNARMDTYDPWASQNQSCLHSLNNYHDKSVGQSQAPYTDFMLFLDSLGMSTQEGSSSSNLISARDLQIDLSKQSAIVDWCVKHGLLGILFHDVKMFRLPYVERQPEGNIYKSIAFYKEQGRWSVDKFAAQPKQQNSQKASTWSYADWETGRVELESYRSSSLFKDQNDKFYWSDPYWIADNYFPFSENIIEILLNGRLQDVWQEYCEPIDFFIAKAETLGRNLWLLTQRSREYSYKTGIDALGMLIGETPVSYGLLYGKVVPQFRTPSLVAAYAVMALEEASRGASLLKCENETCHKWFASKRSNAKFCSANCNSAQQQRKSRKRKKVAKNDGAIGRRVCEGCGASMDGKRPQAKFCTTTCGNTYRKRLQRAKVKLKE